MGLKPLTTVFLGFPEGFLVFFGIFGFPECFCCLKTIGKTNKQKTTKTISKGGSETFKHFVFLLFLMFFWFSLVFFCIFGFPEGFFGFLKTLGKTTKNKQQTHIQGWV